jgi:hypothetical protein
MRARLYRPIETLSDAVDDVAGGVVVDEGETLSAH